MKAFSPLETDRLMLRPISEADFEAFSADMADEDARRYVGRDPCGREEAREILCFLIAEDDIYEFSVSLKDGGQYVGSVGVDVKDGEGELEWSILRAHWNNGYATEAAQALTSFAFKTLNLRRLTAHCDAENAASYRVMQKLGMRRELFSVKARRSNRVLGHTWRDEFGYALLAEEY